MNDTALICLGNPGSAFASTRHNVGWMYARHRAGRHLARLVHPRGVACVGPLTELLRYPHTEEQTRPDRWGQAAWIEVDWEDENPAPRIMLPAGGLNTSGQALAAGPLRPGEHTPPEQRRKSGRKGEGRLILIHDDIDLPFGTVRTGKKGSSHAGHNGVKDLIRHGFDGERIRIGIGIGRGNGQAPPVHAGIEAVLGKVEGPLPRHVLGPFSPEEQARLPELFAQIDRATR